MSKYFCVLILLVVLGCEKNTMDDESQQSKIKRITTVTPDENNNTWADVFKYDAEDRLIEIERSAWDHPLQSTYYYYYDTMVVKHVPADLPRYDTLYLNQDGRASKLLMGGISEFNFEYDSEGFLIIEGNVISGGNVTETHYEYVYDNYRYTEDLEYFYYDHENTIYYDKELPYQIGNDNIGIYFWGTQNKNLLKRIDWPPDGSGEVYREFNYEFDDHNRVTEMEVILWGELECTKIFEYYD